MTTTTAPAALSSLLPNLKAQRDALAAKFPADHLQWRAGRYWWPEMDRLDKAIQRAWKARQQRPH